MSTHYYYKCALMRSGVVSDCHVQMNASEICIIVRGDNQGWPLGGASGALAPGADFEGALKRLSPTGHTLIRSIVAW
jgi:hypothetical protein